MNKAYVDTTILTDALLKPGESGEAAKAALQRFEITQLPVYAIKEFKAGPLSNLAWMHNNLASLGSFHRAIEKLQRMSLTPKRYTTATALDALRAAARETGRLTPSDLETKYGAAGQLDSILCDEYRLHIKTLLFRAWKKRRSLTTKIVQPLSCYNEVAPAEERGQVSLKPTKCRVEKECCLAQSLKGDQEALTKLKEATQQSFSAENQRRYQLLREICRKPKTLINDGACRHLGDVMFAFFAPSDAVILTTNLKDHAPLAEALGKKAERP